MDDTEFDTALVGAAMHMAGADGWRAVSVLGAARAAGLDAARARVRFPSRWHILRALGRLADHAALADPVPEGSARDKLFDVLMRRIDVFQAHRDGVLAVMRALPGEPAIAALLACATERSMGWMAEAAGVSARGVTGALRVRGLAVIWLWTMRAWQADASPDLTATMAALDTALSRAAPFAQWLDGVRQRVPAEDAPMDAGTGEPEEPAGS